MNTVFQVGHIPCLTLTTRKNTLKFSSPLAGH